MANPPRVPYTGPPSYRQQQQPMTIGQLFQAPAPQAPPAQPQAMAYQPTILGPPQAPQIVYPVSALQNIQMQAQPIAMHQVMQQPQGGAILQPAHLAPPTAAAFGPAGMQAPPTVLPAGAVPYPWSNKVYGSFSFINYTFTSPEQATLELNSSQVNTCKVPRTLESDSSFFFRHFLFYQNLDLRETMLVNEEFTFLKHLNQN